MRINSQDRKRYLVSLVDSCTRIAWVEMLEYFQSLAVMFAVWRIMSILKVNYDIRFQEILTDYGPELEDERIEKKEPASI
jgi:hypothetical protein